MVQEESEWADASPMGLDSNSIRKRHDDGFSLVELLVVIVVLGVLAAITVFAVRGLKDESDKSACASDEKVLESAMEAHSSQEGGYVTEALLQSEGFLLEQSTLHDITLSADTYTVVAVGACAGSGATSSAPTVTLPAGVTSLTMAGFPAQQFGSGPIHVLYIGVGSAAAAVAITNWPAILAAAAPSPTAMTVTWVDLSSAGDSITAAQLDALVGGIGGIDHVINQQSAGFQPIEATLPVQVFNPYGATICNTAVVIVNTACI